MIELYSTNITATANMTVPWNTKAVQAGTSATLNNDGQTISLNRAGTYEVTVNGYGSTTAAGTFGFQLNGAAAITRAASSMDTAAGEDGNASFTTLVNVAQAPSPAQATISITYTGGAGTISLANIVIKKIA